MKKYVLLWLVLACVSIGLQTKDLDFRTNSSFISISPGATFVVDQPITNVNGKIIKQAGGTITGKTITFEKGIFEDEGTSSLLQGIFNPIGRFLLVGNDTLRVEPGTLLSEVRVSGNNNKIDGSPILSSNIIVQDSSTTVTFATEVPLNKSIELNGGTIILENDLRFADDQKITGSGTVKVNGYQVIFGGTDLKCTGTLDWENATNIQLNGKIDLSSTWRFTGVNRISGNGNIIDLSSGGTIDLEDDAKLYLTDVVVKGLGDAEGGSFVFSNDMASICMSNVTTELVNDVTLTTGSIIVDGPSTWFIKDHNFIFDSFSDLTVDGVVLFKDQAGAANIGDIAFTGGGTLSLVRNGIIRCTPDTSCCDLLATSTGELQSQIDALEPEDLSALVTSTGYLQSQIDFLDTACIAPLKTSTGELQSQIDRLDSFVDVTESVVDVVESIVESNESRVEILETCCDALSTSTGSLQSQIDALDDFAQSCCDALSTSTGELQSQIDFLNIECITSLKTSTGELQSQIDALDMATDETLLSRVEVLETCCDDLRTSTGSLQSQIDFLDTACIAPLKTSTGELQSQIDRLDSFVDVTESVVDVVESIVESNESRVEILETCCDELRTSTGSLQSQIDFLDTACIAPLKTSTGQLQSQIDIILPLVDIITSDTLLVSMIDMLKTSTGELQSQIDDLFIDIEICKSQIDFIQTDTGELQSQLDRLNTDVLSRLEILETCCDALVSSTGELQSQLDECCLGVDFAECCMLLATSTGSLQSQLDECCMLLATSTGELQSQVDILMTPTVVAGEPCVVSVSGTMTFDSSMISTDPFTVVKFVFESCYAECINPPTLVFEAGEVIIPASSRVIFSGDGVVELKDGVSFKVEGTPFCPDPPDRSDWPALIIENGAIMHLDSKATVSFGGSVGDINGAGGAGKLIVRNCGHILLDEKSHLVMGVTFADDLFLRVECASSIEISHPDALLTFQKACWDIEFDHHSALSVLQGAVEFNMYRCARVDFENNPAEGFIRKIEFDEHSVLQACRRGDSVGTVRMAPNTNPVIGRPFGEDLLIDFNNKCGDVCGGGFIQFKEFAFDPTTLVRALPFPQRACIKGGSVLAANTFLNQQTIFKRHELTADTLIPDDSVLVAGSFVGGVTLGADLIVATDTVFPRGTIIEAGSVIDGISFAAGTTLPAAVLLPPGTILAANTVLAPDSELVNTTLDIGRSFNEFATNDRMMETFGGLAFIDQDEAIISAPEDGTILTALGSLDPALDGRLAAFCPPIRNGVDRDGTIVPLQDGDHDVQYNSSPGSSVLNEIVGYTAGGQQFVIVNCDETTR